MTRRKTVLVVQSRWLIRISGVRLTHVNVVLSFLTSSLLNEKRVPNRLP